MFPLYYTADTKELINFVLSYLKAGNEEKNATFNDAINFVRVCHLSPTPCPNSKKILFKGIKIYPINIDFIDSSFGMLIW